MNDWRARLRDADPLAGYQQPLVPAAASIRRVVVSAARVSDAPRAQRWVSASPLVVGATIVLVVCAGLVAGRRLGQVEPVPARGAAASPARDVRQLQFSTPGGTRIIWIFNPDLNLNETTP